MIISVSVAMALIPRLFGVEMNAGGTSAVAAAGGAAAYAATNIPRRRGGRAG